LKRIVVTGAALLLVLFLLPILLVDGPETAAEDMPPKDLPAFPSPAQITFLPDEPTEPGEDELTTLRVAMEDGSVVEMTMADYLWSVVAAEMPAAFEPEALKAQAITARTYAVWKMAAGDADHPDADVCTDITCCQAYITPEQAAANWENTAAVYRQKIASAVRSTNGQVITYEGEPIQAVFFSSAAGRTEDAVAVWGTEVPYLVGVDSPEGEGVPNYQTEVTLTAAEVKKLVLARYPGADLSGPAKNWFKNRTLTASGRVDTVDVGGITMKGTEVRALFGLRSACFTVETESEKNTVTFHVTGYGHGVGMSQYGANALAKEGKTCEEILKWYYTGVKIG